MTRLNWIVPVLAALVLGASFAACVTPPPKIASIPASGLSLRLYVFGADAEKAHHTFEAIKENNPSFSLVNQGGDAEVVVGLEQDSGACVEPTALCSYQVSYRIRSADGTVLGEATTNVNASASQCSGLCTQALNDVTVKIVELAVSALQGGGAGADAGLTEDAEPEPPAAPASRGKSRNKPPPPPPPPPPKTPTLCAVGAGPRLPSEDAEKRMGQVEALRRLKVLDQAESDCLRTAFLARL